MASLLSKFRKFKKAYIVKEKPHEYAALKYYARILDPFVTKLVYDLGMTPNMVTLISGLFGLSAGGFLLSGYWKTAAVLLQLHLLFDCADGHLARLTGRQSDFGARLDKAVDQSVRFFLFVSLAIVAEVDLLFKVLFLMAIYTDLLVVARFVTPFGRKYPLIRARWKQWFLDRGIIPGFDIFLIYVLSSILMWFGHVDVLIFIVIVGKNADWIYRVWECLKTKWMQERTFRKSPLPENGSNNGSHH